jgi:hypothetical protein
MNLGSLGAAEGITPYQVPQKRKPPSFYARGLPNPTLRFLEFLRSFEFQAERINVSRSQEFPFLNVPSQNELPKPRNQQLVSKAWSTRRLACASASRSDCVAF